ncbi:hypothetical protein I4300191C4_12480 [Solibaculum mannosilyticum]
MVLDCDTGIYNNRTFCVVDQQSLAMCIPKGAFFGLVAAGMGWYPYPAFE